MAIKTAGRLDKIPPYLFVEMRKKINEAKKQGIDVISLAVGDPVEPTPAAVIEELYRQAKKPENHRYPTDEEKGMLAFRQAVADHMENVRLFCIDLATQIHDGKPTAYHADKKHARAEPFQHL